MSEDPGAPRLLVIRLGALGDMITAVRAFRAIRAHHRDAHITLLTTKPYAGIGAQCGQFDDVFVTRRPRNWNLAVWWSEIRALRSRRFQSVYDLQQTDRTALLFRALRAGRPELEWNGAVRGCSHRVDNNSDERRPMHAYERHEDQLRVAGITDLPPVDLDWLPSGLVDRFGVAGAFALLVPGAAVTRPDKRWSATGFATLAEALASHHIRPVLIGTDAERMALGEIAAACPEALDLCGQTDFADLAGLARDAAIAIGNDTGPMHLVAAAGCPCVVLYGHASDPSRTAPRGRHGAPIVTVLQSAKLEDLAPEDVVAAALGKRR